MLSTNYSSTQPSFTAYIPNTLGKKSADALAKKLISSGEETEVKFAQNYYKAIKQLKNEKELNEVVILNSDKHTDPSTSIIFDGYKKYCFDYKSPIRDNLTTQNDKSTFDIMKNLIDITKDLPKSLRSFTYD